MKKTITFSILASFLSMNTYALPATIAKVHQKSSKTKALQAETNKITNFSGTWVGKCEGDDEEETLTINNDEYFINLDGMELQINGSTTVTHSNKDSAENITALVNLTSSDLRIKLTSVSKWFPDEAGDFTSEANILIHRDNDKLTMTGKAVTLETDGSHESPVACTYSLEK